MSKKPLLFFLLLATAGAAAYFYYPKQQQTETNQLTLYGTVDIREAQLAFNSSEHVGKVFVEEGDHVQKGQILAHLHTEVFEAQLRQAKAQMQSYQETLNKLEAGSRKEEINKARAELKAAQAHTKSALDSYKRLIPLLEKKLISPDELEKAKAIADAAQAETEAVRQSLILLQAGPRKEDIAVARANLASSKALVELKQEELNNATLYAPDDGIIRNRILEPGDMAFPSTPALTLAFTDPIWVRAYLPETALGKVKPGSPATIYTDSYPDKPYQAWVGYISPTAEFTPKTVQTEELRTRLVYSVRIIACNPQDELRLGMPVTVEIDTTAAPRTNNADLCNVNRD